MHIAVNASKTSVRNIWPICHSWYRVKFWLNFFGGKRYMIFMFLAFYQNSDTSSGNNNYGYCSDTGCDSISPC